MTIQGESKGFTLKLKPLFDGLMSSLTVMTASLILLLSLAAISSADDQNGFDIMVTPYPPFIDESAEGGGISWQLLTTLLVPFNQPYQVLNLPPARAHILMARDKYLISVLPPGHEGSNHLRFELAETNYHYTLFQLKERKIPWNDISDKKIVSLNFRFGRAYAQKLQAQGAHLISVPNFESGLKMLQVGRVDFLLGIDQTVFNAAEALNMVDELIADENYITTFGALAFYVNMNHPLALEFTQYLEDQELLNIIQTQ